MRLGAIEKSNDFFFSGGGSVVRFRLGGPLRAVVARAAVALLSRLLARRREWRKAGQFAVLLLLVEWWKIGGLGQGGNVSVVHHVGVFDPGQSRNANVSFVLRNARIVMGVSSDASSHAPLEDSSVRSIFGVFYKVVGSAKVHASGEADRGNDGTVLSRSSEILDENVCRG